MTSVGIFINAAIGVALGLFTGGSLLIAIRGWPPPLHHDVIFGAMMTEKYPGGVWMTATYPFAVMNQIYMDRDAYYRSLGSHWYPDCFIPDWRVVEVAVEYGIDPKVAWADAVRRGFSQED